MKDYFDIEKIDIYYNFLIDIETNTYKIFLDLLDTKVNDLRKITV